jgi:hypothetical protein
MSHQCPAWSHPSFEVRRAVNMWMEDKTKERSVYKGIQQRK